MLARLCRLLSGSLVNVASLVAIGLAATGVALLACSTKSKPVQRQTQAAPIADSALQPGPSTEAPHYLTATWALG